MRIGLSVSSNLTWKLRIHSTAKHVLQELDFLSRACGFFVLSSTTYTQICPSLEHCYHVWGGAPKLHSLSSFDKVQSIAIRLINNPNLTKSLLPLSPRR